MCIYPIYSLREDRSESKRKSRRGGIGREGKREDWEIGRTLAL